MKFKFCSALLVLSLLGISTVHAATPPKSVKILSNPIAIEGTFFAGNGGEWFTTLLSKRAIYIVGTSEPATGPTQGEVIAIDPLTKVQLWDLALPALSGAADAIATAAMIDTAGNIWIAGSSSTPVVAPTPKPTPTNVINPSGVVIDPTPPIRSDLTQISLWQVSPDGALIASYQYETGKVLQPLSIKQVKTLFQINGSNFQISIDQSGKFSKYIEASFVPVKVSTTQTFKDGLYIWKSYLSKSAIAHVTGWSPKSALPVVLKVGSRTGAIYSAYKISGELLKVDFLSGLGLVLTTQTAKGYAISLLK
jgi:hypothetical protein